MHIKMLPSVYAVWLQKKINFAKFIFATGPNRMNRANFFLISKLTDYSFISDVNSTGDRSTMASIKLIFRNQ